MNMSALVIDSDPERGQRVARLCEQAALDTRHCLDAETALAETPERSVDLVVTQLSLPTMDAFDMLSRIRRRPRMEKTRVVAMSAFGELLATAHSMRNTIGIDVVLTNSVSGESLLRAVRTLVWGAAAQVTRLRDLEQPGEAAAANMPGHADRASESARKEAIALGGFRKLPVHRPDPELQAYVGRVSQRFQVPIVAIGLAFDDRLVFAARHGLEVEAMDRYSTLCSRVIAEGDPLFVPDARKSSTFHTRDDVQAGMLRGYASAPLRLDSGDVVGNLALVNPSEPLKMGLEDVRAFRASARELASILVERTALYA